MSCNSQNEILLQIEVISKPKILFSNSELEPNLNKKTFFLCDTEMNQKNFVSAGNPNELEISTFDELNAGNCDMYLDNVKIPFEKYHTFTEEGIHTVKYVLKNKITSCKKMFLSCEYITSIDLHKFNSEDVTDMSLMFLFCRSLSKINFGNFNTSKVTNMEGMFEGCCSLKSLNLSSFDTSKVENMNSMFILCVSLQELDLSNFNTENVKDMNSLFGALSIEYLDLSSFSSKSLVIMNYMFGKCFDLKKIKFSDKFQPNNIQWMYGVFEYCNNLEILECSEDLYDVFVEKETEIYNLEKVKFVSIDGPKPEILEFKSQYHEHILKKKLMNDKITCEYCTVIYENIQIFSCEECNFNICALCAKMEKKKGYIGLKGALHQHEMKLQTNYKDCSCNECGEKLPENKNWYFCELCNIAYCRNCTQNILMFALLLMKLNKNK